MAEIEMKLVRKKCPTLNEGLPMSEAIETPYTRVVIICRKTNIMKVFIDFLVRLICELSYTPKTTLTKE